MIVSDEIWFVVTFAHETWWVHRHTKTEGGNRDLIEPIFDGSSDDCVATAFREFDQEIKRKAVGHVAVKLGRQSWRPTTFMTVGMKVTLGWID